MTGSLAGLTCLDMTISSTRDTRHPYAGEFLRADNIKATPLPPRAQFPVFKSKMCHGRTSWASLQAWPMACELQAPPCICTQLKREQQSRRSPGRLSTSGQINEKPPAEPLRSLEGHPLPPLPLCVFVSSQRAAEAYRKRMLLDEDAVSYTVVYTVVRASDASSAPFAMLWNLSPIHDGELRCSAPGLLSGMVAVGHSQVAACGAGPLPIPT
jgi:hypothetical protein